MYEIISLIVAMHNHATQFKRRPGSISSYLVDPGLIRWIKAA